MEAAAASRPPPPPWLRLDLRTPSHCLLWLRLLVRRRLPLAGATRGSLAAVASVRPGPRTVARAAVRRDSAPQRHGGVGLAQRCGRTDRSGWMPSAVLALAAALAHGPSSRRIRPPRPPKRERSRRGICRLDGPGRTMMRLCPGTPCTAPLRCRGCDCHRAHGARRGSVRRTGCVRSTRVRSLCGEFGV
jgi:hypothetical protein